MAHRPNTSMVIHQEGTIGAIATGSKESGIQTLMSHGFQRAHKTASSGVTQITIASASIPLPRHLRRTTSPRELSERMVTLKVELIAYSDVGGPPCILNLKCMMKCMSEPKWVEKMLRNCSQNIKINFLRYEPSCQCRSMRDSSVSYASAAAKMELLLSTSLPCLLVSLLVLGHVAFPPSEGYISHSHQTACPLPNECSCESPHVLGIHSFPFEDCIIPSPPYYPRAGWNYEVCHLPGAPRFSSRTQLGIGYPQPAIS
ncbi:hypothetical protein QJS10_CPB21g01138 [Acorus calamus]|uniref:Uncharacterized protein n=1 Tax=Acorus calamus TaxID=4465 RepID=A0AAV9C771_ACOCL|nr:hypothetical protein QJS10_CPB21g01138 [Acorus calamus]